MIQTRNDTTARPHASPYPLSTSTASRTTESPATEASVNSPKSTTVTLSNRAISLAAADRTAPKITGFSPTDGGKNVSLTANMVVTFSEAVQRGTGNIVLTTASGDVVETFNAATSRRISISGAKLTIDPTQKLENGTHYLVSFDAGVVTDRAGNAFAGTSTYDFTTVPERIAPKATSFFAGNGTTNVSPTQSLAIVFSENIQRGKGDIILKDAKGKTVEVFKASSSRVSVNGNVLSISPTKTLSLNTKYSLGVAAGAVKDLAGNAFKGSGSYSFRTAATDTPPVPVPQPTVPSAPSGGGSSGGGGGGGGGGSGAFSISLNYSGDPSYLSYFEQAKAFWENVITGDLVDVNGIDDLQVTAQVNAIDGSGGILGQAGPNTLRSGSNLPITGTMTFDSADMANMASSGILARVIMHEMGHVLGLGSLWSIFGLNTTPGQYTGANALAAYRAIAGGSPAYVPLENNGGGGTANVHWEEDVFTTELMTGYADGAMHLSRVTIGALADLGYTVNYGAAETSGLSIMAPGAALNVRA